MTVLVRPDVRFQGSWLAAAAEFAGSRMDGSGMDVPDLAVLAGPSAFESLVLRLLADEQETSPRPSGYVPSTALWIVDQGEFVGSLQIRHRLTPFLLEQGGHIGYSVRPSSRRRGYASATLRDSLPIAAALGIGPALVTCDEDNVGSRAIIERAGGRYEDSRAGKRRYWIRTAD